MKRALTGVAWAFALLWVQNYVTLVTGSSAALLSVVAVATGALIAVDPLGKIWGLPNKRRAPATNEQYPATEAVARF